MPFQSQKEKLILSVEGKEELETLVGSPTERMHRIERAKILLGYAGGASVSEIARKLGINRPKVERCINKALQLGVAAALRDLPGRGKKPTITREAKAWLVSLACRKAKELGYARELWTTRLLAKHVRQHCRQAGHPTLEKISPGTVSKILAEQARQPHKVRHDVERRDPQFEQQRAQVLYVYKQVQMLRKKGEQVTEGVAIFSYDEKPGIQAVENAGGEHPPVPGLDPCWTRDYEYIRGETLSLLAGIDLLTGHVHTLVAERHRSREFIQFLQRVDDFYPPSTKIRMILDNHSTHLSKETRVYLASLPNRFEFIFTPKHGSWLNLVESFFAKLAKTFLRGMRVTSKEELSSRLEQYLKEINDTPVIFRWKDKLDTLSLI